MKTSPEHDAHQRGRRKGMASRQWLVVSSSGQSHMEEVGKNSIKKRTGLPARDLRVLDPLLSYPSTILGRERAIVINLEHIKAIVTATEVLIPNSKDPMVGPFVQDLRVRVSSFNAANNQAVESSDMNSVATSKATLCLLQNLIIMGVEGQGTVIPRPQTTLATTSSGEMTERSSVPALNLCKDGISKGLPFEFRALEICLESACRCLETETLTLEKEAYPALDELTSKLSRLNLEHVRQLKSRLVAISGRVQKVRDELEHLLDDDMDMAEMYLSEKLACQLVDEDTVKIDGDDLAYEEDREEGVRNETESSRGTLGGFKPNVEELEMLLEAYFVQIDGTLNKLSHLREYVDDTEDYINIMLDEKQNQLLQMGVVLSTATLVLAAGIVVVSIFGMNITIDITDDTVTPPSAKFWQTTFGTIGGCVGLYVIAFGWGKKSGLLQ